MFMFEVVLQSIYDRFYTALYGSLLDARLADSSKQTLYLNLLFRAMNLDTTTNRVMAFVKRLVQTLSCHSPPYIIGALHLLGEVGQNLYNVALHADCPFSYSPADLH